MSEILLEVCVASVEDAIAASDGGANRLELNVAMELGGLTPTQGLLEEVKLAVKIPVIVMIRPRAAGFRYSSTERRLMLRDAESLLERGADGLAVGSLRPDRTIDIDFLHAIHRFLSGRELVFHRAFDLLENPDMAIQQLIDCGTTRILTAGGFETAAEGKRQIERFVKLAADRIEILPAGGISSNNVEELIRVTGCKQVHGSFRKLKQDPAGSISDPHYPGTCRSRVIKMRAILDRMVERG